MTTNTSLSLLLYISTVQIRTSRADIFHVRSLWRGIIAGKSSISLRLVRSKWTHEYDPTVQDSYSVTRIVDGREYQLALTGMSNRSSVIQSIHQPSSLSKPESFTGANVSSSFDRYRWARRVQTHLSEPSLLHLVIYLSIYVLHSSSTKTNVGVPPTPADIAVYGHSRTSRPTRTCWSTTSRTTNPWWR